MNVFAQPDKPSEARGLYPAQGYGGGGYGGGAITAGPDPDDDGIDLRGLFLTLWRRKWVIVVAALVSVVLAVLAVSQMVPQYSATAKIFYDPQRVNVIDLEAVLVNSEAGRDSMQNQIEVLRSTTLLERVAAELRLDETPEFNPALRTAPPSLGERARRFVNDQVAAVRTLLTDLGVLAPPPPAQTIDPAEQERRRTLAIVGALRGGLNLRPVGTSRVVDISFTSTNPRLAARIVNTVADQYIVDQLEAKLQATRSATDWLSGRVEELQDRVRAAEDAVEAARTALSLEAGQGSAITQEQLRALNASLTVVRTALSNAESRYDTVTEAIEIGRDFGVIAEFRQSGIIQSYRAQESELRSQRMSLEASVAEGHPALLRLDARLDEVRRNIRTEAELIAASIRNDVEAQRAQERRLVADLRALETRALAQSRAEVELRQLEREAQASRLLYENFLARLQETSEQQGLQTADARVLSRAETPGSPEAASKRRIVVLAGMGGVLLGIGLVFLLERLNNTFRGVGEVEAQTGQVVLATLPRIGTRLHRRDVLAHIRKKPNSSLAEAVRNLRTSILFSNLDKPPQVVMFTSSAPREGKSTTSMLVALASRQMGKSAVIVDCDLRLPALASLFDQKREHPGLLGVLEGTATLEDAIFEEKETGLHVLTTHAKERRAQVSAADILASNRFRALIASLKERYDLVILDTPPVLVVTDARIVASLADAVIYAVRWDDTPRGAVLEGLRELTSVNAPVAGVVLTLVNEARAAKYAYDNYGYYKGRYKDYYIS